MNDRADALVSVGSWLDAVDQLREAKKLPEDGGEVNVSQAINLGKRCSVHRTS